MCVPDDSDLKRGIVEKAHKSDFTINHGSSKMYQDLKWNFWWPRRKKDITKFVTRCVVCRQVKIEHQRLGGMLQPLEIPEWKWESIYMDFIVGYPACLVVMIKFG